MKQFLLTGYSRWPSSFALAKRAVALDAAIADIRLSPQSRQYEFTKHALERLLLGRYSHVRGWGNLNYKTGGAVELADFQGGLEQVLTIEKETVILLCVCKNAATCHRRTVGERLRELGYEVVEMEVGEETPSLF